MISEIEVLKQVAQLLNSISIPYMISGSVALSFYVTPRMTRDIDLVVEIKSAQVKKLVDAFHANYYVDGDMILHALKHGIPFNVIHLNTVTKVDFIPKKDTPYHQIAFGRKRVFPLSGEKFLVISPEDLIISKLDWSKDSLSETQLKDIQSLLKFPQLDRDYINEWVVNLQLGSIFTRALQ